jgi:hypothetical protein
MRLLLRVAVCVVALSAATLCGGPARAAFEYPRPASFAVGGEPTLIAHAMYSEVLQGRSSLWVGRRGALDLVRPAAFDALELVETFELPAASVPIAIDESTARTFVLDAAGGVLVYTHLAGESRLVTTLATGAEPSAMVVGDKLLAVANAGSNDISIYTWGADGSFSAERRVAVGVRPRALLIKTFGGQPALAVANEGSGSLTFIRAQGDFPVLGQVPVGGAPVSLADAERFAVGYADAPRVTLWRSGAHGLVPSGAVALGGPASRANLLDVADLDEDGHAELVIGDRATGTVAIAAGRRGGGVDRPGTVFSGIDPLGLVAGWDVGGDWHRDVAVIDGRARTVERRLTPGDPLVVADAAVEHLEANDGRVAWSRRGGDGRHRLIVREHGRTIEIPGTTSDVPLAPHMGRLRPGRPVVSFVACRAARCRPRAWEFGRRRARRLTIAGAQSCQVREIAIWDQWRAYELGRVGRRQCPAPRRGLWLKVRAGQARRPGGGQARLGRLRDGYLVWTTRAPDPETDFDIVSVRLRRLSEGATRKVYELGLADSLRGLGSSTAISGRYVYWTYTSEATGEVARAPLRDRRACGQTFPRRDSASGLPGAPGNAGADFDVDRGRLVYTNGFLVFRVDPARLRWSRRWCR